MVLDLLQLSVLQPALHFQFKVSSQLPSLLSFRYSLYHCYFSSSSFLFLFIIFLRIPPPPPPPPPRSAFLLPAFIFIQLQLLNSLINPFIFGRTANFFFAGDKQTVAVSLALLGLCYRKDEGKDIT